MSKAISTTTTEALPLPSTSRRRLLAGPGLTAIAAVFALPSLAAPISPATSPNHPDAALLAMCATFAGLTASIRRMNAAETCDWDDLTATNIEWHDTLEDLSDMRPVTLAGAQAKAQAVVAAFELDVPSGISSTVEDDSEPHEWAAWRLLHDVLALGGAA